MCNMKNVLEYIVMVSSLGSFICKPLRSYVEHSAVISYLDGLLYFSKMYISLYIEVPSVCIHLKC